jgi:hypothetical protein
VAHAFNPSTWEAEAGGILSSKPASFYRVSSRTARATQRNPVSKKQKKKRERERERDGSSVKSALPGDIRRLKAARLQLLKYLSTQVQEYTCIYRNTSKLLEKKKQYNQTTGGSSHVYTV